ncbi:MAG: hypothetical protein IJ809_01110 [Clostridia bacterium]|nr:hypothetical protein [Clostridia bacterium]
MNEFEREAILVEAEEFFDGTSYAADLSYERDEKRAKVRNKRRSKRVEKKSNSTNFLEGSLLFKITKKRKALVDQLSDTANISEIEKISRELDILDTALDNILAASSNSRKLKKALLKYKDVA